MTGLGSVRTVSASGAIGSLGGHAQAGGFVPGIGSGDIIPMMLEPGELIVPKNLVSVLRMVLGGAGSFPGAAALRGVLGRMAGAGGPPGHIGGGDGISPVLHGIAPALSAIIGGHGAAGPLPVSAAADKVFDAFEKTFKGMGNPWGRLASEILQGLIDGVKNAPHMTKKAAEELVSKVSQEIAFGKNLAASTLQGLNIAGMQVPAPGSLVNMHASPRNLAEYNAYVQAFAANQLPGEPGVTQPKSVQQQMQDYLASIKAFGKDIGVLSKGGLNKDVLRQLLSAGPVQGDALAQSILGGAGGIHAVNQLYKQIQQASTGLGVTGMEAIFGKPKTIHVDATKANSDVSRLRDTLNSLHDKAITIHLKVEGSASLDPGLVKGLLQQFQEELLKQARRNTKTGILLKSKR
jgi:hypothetical protein